MNLNSLQGRYENFVDVLFNHRFLDGQFKLLHQLENETDPNFVEDLLTMFFNESEKCINNIAQALQQSPVEFNVIYEYFHQLKGSSVSVGAGRVKDVCEKAKYPCDAKKLERCKICLQELQKESALLKSNLQNLFTLQREIVAAGGSIPKIQ